MECRVSGQELRILGSGSPRAAAYAEIAAGSADSAGSRSQNRSWLREPQTNISPALIAVASSRTTTTSNCRRFHPRTMSHEDFSHVDISFDAGWFPP